MIIEEAKRYITELFNGTAAGHDTEHSMRVYKIAMEIAKGYPEVDATVIALAALLHDTDDHKLFDHENNENTREFLKSQNVDEEVTEKICEVINTVSFSKNRGRKPGTIEGAIVQDADRLVAMGAIGIARTFAYGGKAGRGLSDSIKHFYDKLLLLKEEMNTDAAKEMAQKRHEYMKDFLEEYYLETGYRYEG